MNPVMPTALYEVWYADHRRKICSHTTIPARNPDEAIGRFIASFGNRKTLEIQRVIAARAAAERKGGL